MKNKYVMINGFAFSEESDMEKLRKYASEGWILEGVTGVFFYKLKKDKPQDIVYTLDYQTEANEEYFTLFKEAGWKPVVSMDNQMHIFSAQAGTKPIYSDCESEIDKYTSVRNITKKGTHYSLIVAIILIGLLAVSLIAFRPVFLIILGLLIIDIFVFAFNFMPYLAYNSRIEQIEKHGECKGETINSKSSWKMNAFIGVTFLVLGIFGLTQKSSYFWVGYIIIGVLNIYVSMNYYKKYKKSL